MAELTDEQIVQDLVDIGRVSEIEQDVWRHQEGYVHTEGFGLNRKYGVGTRTLQKWARAVRIEVVKRREEVRQGRVRFGHTLADGSRTRFAVDGTPLGHMPGCSWNEERIKAQLLGTQRKPALLPPTGRKKQVVNAVQRADRDYEQNHEK